MHVYLLCFLLFIALKEDSMAFGNPTKLVFVLKLDLKLTRLTSRGLRTFSNCTLFADQFQRHEMHYHS